MATDLTTFTQYLPFFILLCIATFIIIILVCCLTSVSSSSYDTISFNYSVSVIISVIFIFLSYWACYKTHLEIAWILLILYLFLLLAYVIMTFDSVIHGFYGHTHDINTGIRID